MKPVAVDIDDLIPHLNIFVEGSPEDRLLIRISEIIQAIDDPANLIILGGMANEVFRELTVRFGIPAVMPGPETTWKMRRTFHLLFWICFGTRVIDPELDRSKVTDTRALEESVAYLEFLQDLAEVAKPTPAPLAERVGQVLFGMPTYWTNRS